MYNYYPYRFSNLRYNRYKEPYNEPRNVVKEPFVADVNKAAMLNTNFRTTVWTGDHLQVTLMSINPSEDIGLEAHENLDQLIYIHDGQGMVMMGDSKDNLDYKQMVSRGYVIIIPAGKYHNLINTGTTPIKLHSVYAPPEHGYSTVHKTKLEAEAEEHKLH